MKHMEMVGNTPFLPQEIISDILIRLPVKSLLRFQCVCKDWKNLFKSQSFIEDHFQYSSNANPFLLLKCYAARKLHNYCLLDVDEEDVKEIHKIPLKNSNLIVRDFHANHGLLCLEVINNKSHSLLLYNPATKEVLEVPKCLRLFRYTYFVVGFGFNPVVNDYDIVRLFISLKDEMVYKVEVYSLSIGSWKEVEVGNFGAVKLRYDKGFCANGAIFWFGYKTVIVDMEEMLEIYYSDGIVSFDLATKVSTLIPMPSEMHYKDGVCLTLYEHKLAILYPNAIEDSEAYSIDLWVMEEAIGASGEKWSWTKKYTCSPFPCPHPWMLYPETIWRNKIICRYDVKPETYGKLKGERTKIVLFNLTYNESKGDVMTIYSYSREIFNYAESVVPLQQHPC